VKNAIDIYWMREIAKKSGAEVFTMKIYP